jgi:hypothetical protein
MRKLTFVGVLSVTLAAIPADAARVEIILDVSGSMRAAMGAETRMDAARKAIRATLAGVQADSVVALRLYGHRVVQDSRTESCRDTELAVPFQHLDKAGFLAVVDRAQPRGQTPLTYSLEQAAQDFGPVSDEERVIILVSDGAESCGGDPAGTARKLLAQGFKLKVHTVGLDVDAAARAQLEAVSTATGGEYRDARDPAALSDILTRLTQRSLLIAKGSDSLGEEIRGGDGSETAVALQPGRLYRLDHHQRGGQFDYFFVAVEGKKKVVASIETSQRGVMISGDSYSEGSNAYGGITLQDGSRRKLGEVLAIGAGEKKTVESSLAGDQGGRLYLLVGGTYDQHKDCRFGVSLADLAGDAGSVGDAGPSEGDAMAIAPGSYKGNLDPPADDTDVFKFTADPQATYRVRLRPTTPSAWMSVSVASADGAISQDLQEAEGKPVVIDNLRFPRAGDVFVRVGYNKYYGLTPATEYSLEISPTGGSAAMNAPSASPASSPAGGPSIATRLVSLLLWTGVPLVFGLAVGAAGGYMVGRRRR